MAKMNAFGQNLKDFLFGSIYPENFCCLLCDVEIFEGELCADCLDSLSVNDGATCPKCGRKTGKSEICIECKANMPSYERAFSPFVYEGGSAEAVAAFKGGRTFMADYFAERMAATLNGLPEVDGIVCVPMTAKALRRRGYNQSELLARALSRRTGVPFFEKAVKKVKETPAQKELGRARRVKNLQNCFKADKGTVSGKKLLVVDDVITTGATVDGMALTLKNAGACLVFVVTAASVEYKNQS